jgi:hypothetical protein
MTAFLQILSDSLLMNNPTVRLYTVWILTTSLKEPQKIFLLLAKLY